MHLKGEQAFLPVADRPGMTDLLKVAAFSGLIKPFRKLYFLRIWTEDRKERKNWEGKSASEL